MGLQSIVNDGVPPTLMRVRDLFPDASEEKLTDYWESAMIQYQRENAKLFDVMYDTPDRFKRVLWRNIVSMSASRSLILLSCTVTVLPGTVTERGVTPLLPRSEPLP